MNWDRSVELYQEYGKSFPQYRETSRKLVEFSETSRGDLVVDLGCGTGFTTREILRKEPEKVSAVDSSEEMLKKARNFIHSENIVFIQGKARNISKIVDQTDRVLCNSAFWYFDIEEAVGEIEKVLEDSGSFTFNLNPYFLEMEEESHRKPVVDAIMEELEDRNLKPAVDKPDKLSEKDLRKKFRENGLKIVETDELRLKGSSLKDSIEFFRIPAVSPVPENQREEVLCEVENNLDPEEFPITDNVWKCFRAEKI